MANANTLTRFKWALKFHFTKRQIEARHFESCFGSNEGKYRELHQWLNYARQGHGDLVECGVATGGTTCLMAQWIRSIGSTRRIHAFDSFSGFDPVEYDMAYYQGDVVSLAPKDDFQTPEHSPEYVNAKLKAFGLQDLVVLHPGYFTDTLEPFLCGRSKQSVSFALIDCDLGNSVTYCADLLHEWLAPGGVILFDDFATGDRSKPHTAFSPGVQKAVHAFVAAHPTSEHGLNRGLYHYVKPQRRAATTSRKNPRKTAISAK